MLTREDREKYLTVSEAVAILELDTTEEQARQFLRAKIRAGELEARCTNPEAKRPTYLIDRVKLDQFKQQRLQVQSVKPKCTCACHKSEE